MTDRGVTESVVEQAALAWLESLGWRVTYGLEVAPGELEAERSDPMRERGVPFARSVRGLSRSRNKSRG